MRKSFSSQAYKKQKMHYFMAKECMNFFDFYGFQKILYRICQLKASPSNSKRFTCPKVFFVLPIWAVVVPWTPSEKSPKKNSRGTLSWQIRQYFLSPFQKFRIMQKFLRLRAYFLKNFSCEILFFWKPPKFLGHFLVIFFLIFFQKMVKRKGSIIWQKIADIIKFC